MEPITPGRIALISLDLDGTLLRSDADVGPETLAAIRRVAERGVKITLSSGRVPAMMGLYLRLLDITGPYVAVNGALVLHGGDRLADNPLARDELGDLTAFCRERGLHYCLQAEETLFFTGGNPRVGVARRYNALAGHYGAPPAAMATLAPGEWSGDESIYKVILQPPDRAGAVALEAYLTGRRNLTHTFSEAGLFDVTAPGADKGRGIALVADHYGIPLEEVCAFGDYDNDLSIFRRVGVTVAMGNASTPLRRAARYHTASNDSEGIARAIEALWPNF